MQEALLIGVLILLFELAVRLGMLVTKSKDHERRIGNLESGVAEVLDKLDALADLVRGRA